MDTIISVWKNKLLDLTKRNKALNFTVNKVSTVTVVDELPPEIFRLLCLKRKSLRFGAINDSNVSNEESSSETVTLFDDIEDDSGTGSIEEADRFVPYDITELSSRHTDDILQTNSTFETLEKSLRRIDDQARSIIEEQGVNALFLALGMLHYNDDKDSKIIRRAPLVLVPVELLRKSAREGFKVSMTDEEIILNPSLVEYLKNSFGITIPELPDISTLTDEYDLQSFFTSLGDLFSNNKDWKITNEIYLGLLFFQKLVMYKDLEKNVEAVKRHKIFQRIINKKGESHIGLPDEIKEMSLDETFAPENCMQVVDADSSQLRAMAAVAKNYDLVMEGPPGTGKSQTITNIIAQSLSEGKSVLFVAEKMAALEVVFRRLHEVGLGEACLELHSTKANKKSVMQDLRKTLDFSLTSIPSTDIATQRLPLVRKTLTDYISAVHLPFGVLAKSPFQIYARLENVLDSPKMLLEADISGISDAELEDVLRKIEDLSVAGHAIGLPQEHPWRETSRTYYSEHSLDEIKSTGEMVIERIKTLRADSGKLQEILGLGELNSFSDIEIASNVATTLARSPGAPLEVLQSEAWNSAPPEAIELIRLGRDTNRLLKRVERHFSTDVFEFDPVEQIEYIEVKLDGFKKYFAFFDSKYRSIQKQWLSLRLESFKGSLLDQAQEMKFVSEYLASRSSLESRADLASQLFGSLWDGETSNWEELDRYIQWVLEFRQMYVERGLSQQAISTASHAHPDLSFVQTLRQDSIEIRTLLEKLSSAVGWNENYFKSSDVASIRSRIVEIVDNISLAQRWAAFESARQKIAECFAHEILNWVWSGQIKLEDLSRTFQRSCKPPVISTS